MDEDLEEEGGGEAGGAQGDGLATAEGLRDVAAHLPHEAGDESKRSDSVNKEPSKGSLVTRQTGGQKNGWADCRAMFVGDRVWTLQCHCIQDTAG